MQTTDGSAVNGHIHGQRPATYARHDMTYPTVSLPGNLKTPSPNLLCKLSTGEDRPFPCEFRLDRIVFYKNGAVLGQVTPTLNTITRPYAKLNDTVPAVTTASVVEVYFFFTRINPPNFPETNLLLAQINHSPNDKQYKPTDTGLSAISKVPVGQSFNSIPIPLVWLVNHKGEKQGSFGWPS